MDNGGEYIETDLLLWFREKGRNPEYSPPYSLESNGRAERPNRILLESERTMMHTLFSFEYYKSHWAGDVLTANYLKNRSFSTAWKSINNTQIEAITGHRPNGSRIRIFGCKSIVYIDTKKWGEGKISMREKEVILVGYGAGSAYKIYFPKKKNLQLARI